MRITKSDILGQLPVFENNRNVLVDDQSTNDIVQGILNKHRKHKADYDRISETFLGRSPRATAQNIWNFLKMNVPYKIESTEAQTVRSPQGIVAMPGDCKSYALFANGVLDSLNRKGLQKVPIAYRFASYTRADRKDPKHVFSVMYPGTDKEIWVDPVLSSFDQHREPMYLMDKIIKPMALIEISGFGSAAPAFTREAHLENLFYLRNGLQKEYLNKIASGEIKPASKMDQEYREGISRLNNEIATVKTGKIGFIDPATITAGVSLITSLFGKHDDGPGYLGWDRLDAKRGNPLASSAADVIYNRRTDVPMSDLLSYIQADGLQGILANRKYGTITMDTIADYFQFRGYPSEAAALRRSLNPVTQTPVVDPSSPVKKDNTLMLVLLGGGALYLLTKKTKRK